MMRTLGNTGHRLLKSVPSGRYAQVYEGLRDGKPAVIKVARPVPLDMRHATGPAFASAGVALQTGSVGAWEPSPNDVIKAEAQVLQRVRHPGFGTLLEQGEVSDAGASLAYLITERIAGRTLRHSLAGGKEPKPEQLIKLVRLLVDLKQAGLAFHGDIKPDNIIADAKGEVYLIDPSCNLFTFDEFGNPLRLFTTLAYNPLLLASDIPSLGVMFLEWLSGGRHPLTPVDDSKSSREVGPELQLWIHRMNATGRGKRARLFPWMYLPSDHGNVDSKLEAMALRCLGLALDADRVLERTEPFTSVEEVAAELEP